MSRVVRSIVTAVVAIDLLALAGLSFHQVTTTRTSAPAVGSVAEALSGSVATPEPSVGVAVPLASAPPARPATRGPGPSSSGKAVPRGTSPAGSPVAESAAEPLTCPYAKDLGSPVNEGGLQTLIGYAPAFGPFKDEAFAAAAAYQPLLQLLGPILAQYPTLAPLVEPAIGPWIDQFGALVNAAYPLLAPLYDPYRPALLTAEQQLAEALAPLSAQVAKSPAGACLRVLEAALLNDVSAGQLAASPTASPSA